MEVTGAADTVPAEVLAAFGAYGPVEPIAGGQGTAWRAGGVVLKPTGLPEETAWRAEVLAGLPPSPRFRVARPVRARDGGWVAHGWEAWQEIPGVARPDRYDEILATGEAFHAALRDLPRPAFLDRRDDPWSFGDRVAWGEAPVGAPPAWQELLERLGARCRPVDLPAQPVHGDLGGNVLFADGLAPAVIDWPVYYRPAAWPLAVVVVDAVTWNGAPATLLDRGAAHPQWDQLLVRALRYRIATNEGFRRSGRPVREHPGAYRAVVRQVLARIGDEPGGPRPPNPSPPRGRR